MRKKTHICSLFPTMKQKNQGMVMMFSAENKHCTTDTTNAHLLSFSCSFIITLRLRWIFTDGCLSVKKLMIYLSLSDPRAKGTGRAT